MKRSNEDCVYVLAYIKLYFLLLYSSFFQMIRLSNSDIQNDNLLDRRVYIDDCCSRKNDYLDACANPCSYRWAAVFLSAAWSYADE